MEFVSIDVCPNSVITRQWNDVKSLCNLLCDFVLLCLQCFDAVGWAAGRASGL